MRSLVALVAIACAFVTLPSPAQVGANTGTQTPAHTAPLTAAEAGQQAQAPGQAAANAPYGFGLGLGLGSQPTLNPLTQPTLTPGMLHLMELETRFAAAVATGGGPAFASWFAEDGVTLSNGRPPVIGRAAIAAEAQWNPREYQLTWTAQGAQMGPSNDMGFTWGHYDGTGKDSHGQPITHSGRYMTVWKKMPDESWKVLLDASAEEPADPGSCCSLPKP
jgi:ketosteroid isomerase-like protein